MAGQRSKKRRWFTAERRETYLGNLRRTANHEAAARAAGIGSGAARRHRQRKPEFEAVCCEAEAEAQRRLAGAHSPFDGAGAFECIRRGAQLVPRHATRYSSTISASSIVSSNRRAKAGHRRRLSHTEAANDNEAEEAAEDEEERAPPPSCGRSPSPANAGEDRGAQFDPELAMRFLKWRADKKRGQQGPTAALPPAEEVRERIVRKVVAIKRHKALMAKRAGESES